MVPARILVAFCTFPDAATAAKIVREMVERRLAACGSVISPVSSIYRWKGKVESGEEALAIFKLPEAVYSEFEKQLRSLHPYEVPEIIALPVERGLPAYIEWAADSGA